MLRAVGILASVAIGFGIGLVVNRLPVKPVFRSVLAVLLSWVVASFLASLLWLLRPVTTGGIGAMSFGLAEGFMTSLLVVTIGGIAHFALGRIGAMVYPALVTHRAVVMGVLGGAAGSLVGFRRLTFGG